MIFATVGTQLPFDRLVSALDSWLETQEQTEVFAQIGVTSYRPRRLKWKKFLDGQEFSEHFENATAIVAHAGIGSILPALELGKPIVIMPRLAELGEHRNDHQLATARRFEQMQLVSVAYNTEQLIEQLEHVGSKGPSQEISCQASPDLLLRLRQFILAASA